MTSQPLKLTLLALVLFLASNVRAQGDLDLLAASVPPNVMILFDNSGSMNHHLWDDDFDTSVIYSSWCGLLSGATGTISYSINPGSSTWNLDLCGVTRALYHDTSTPQNTRYDANYLNWLYGVATPAQLSNESNQTRLQAAKVSITSVIDAVNPDDAAAPLGYQERVRFGVANFRTGSNPDGGYVSVPIANGNKTAVKNGIDATVGNTWTPLSESLVDVGRYFAGTNLLGSYSQYDKNTTDGVINKQKLRYDATFDVTISGWKSARAGRYVVATGEAKMVHRLGEVLWTCSFSDYPLETVVFAGKVDITKTITALAGVILKDGEFPKHPDVPPPE